MSQSKLAMNTDGINYIYSLPSKYRTAQVQEVIAANRDCFEVTPTEDESLKSVDRIVRLIEGLVAVCGKPRKGVKLYFANRPGSTLSYNAPPPPHRLPIPVPVSVPSPAQRLSISPPRPFSPPSPLRPVLTPSSPLSQSLSLEWPPSRDDCDGIFDFEFDDIGANPVSGDGDMRLSFSSRSMHYDEGDHGGVGQGWTLC